MRIPLPRIAAVVLNYNSERDLKECVERLREQRGVSLSVIIVDNASSAASLAALNAWLASRHLNAAVGTETEITAAARARPSAADLYLIRNTVNLGYSAGNNCGIRLALGLGAEAVLVVNPDVRIDDPRYLNRLATPLLADPKAGAAGSRIVGLDGADQSPLRESTFTEELLWPLAPVRRWLRSAGYALPVDGDSPIEVPKLSGCCLLLSRTFLLESGGFDPGVFLYCEEAIMSARLRSHGKRALFIPTLRATHAHVASEKGDPSRRMLLFIQSRRYYLSRYSGYPRWKRLLLSASYSALAALHQWRIARQSRATP